MLGPRIGRWDSSKEPAMGSATNTIIGVFMLWWAWIAFNQVKMIETSDKMDLEERDYVRLARHYKPVV